MTISVHETRDALWPLFCVSFASQCTSTALAIVLKSFITPSFPIFLSGLHWTAASETFFVHFLFGCMGGRAGTLGRVGGGSGGEGRGGGVGWGGHSFCALVFGICKTASLGETEFSCTSFCSQSLPQPLPSRRRRSWMSRCTYRNSQQYRYVHR